MTIIRRSIMGLGGFVALTGAILRARSKTLLVVGALPLVAVLASAAAPSTPSPAAFAVKGDIETGKKLYVVNCAACHGKKGNGDGIAGLALKPPPASFSDVKRFTDVSDWELFVAVRSGGAAVKLSPAMPAWSPALKDDEIDDVLAYVKASFLDPAKKTAPTK